MDNYDKMTELYKDEKCKDFLKCLLQECIEHVGTMLLVKDREISETIKKELELHQHAYHFLNCMKKDLIADNE